MLGWPPLGLVRSPRRSRTASTFQIGENHATATIKCQCYIFLIFLPWPSLKQRLTCCTARRHSALGGSDPGVVDTRAGKLNLFCWCYQEKGAGANSSWCWSRHLRFGLAYACLLLLLLKPLPSRNLPCPFAPVSVASPVGDFGVCMTVLRTCMLHILKYTVTHRLAWALRPKPHRSHQQTTTGNDGNNNQQQHFHFPIKQRPRLPVPPAPLPTIVPCQSTPATARIGWIKWVECYRPRPCSPPTPTPPTNHASARPLPVSRVFDANSRNTLFGPPHP